jgi:hypothetical protein
MTVYTVTKVLTNKYGEPECEELGVFHKSEKAQKVLEKQFAADLNKMLKAKTNPDCLVMTWLDRFFAEISTRAINPLDNKPNERKYRYYVGKTTVK